MNPQKKSSQSSIKAPKSSKFKRTCIVCRKRDDKGALIRLRVGSDGVASQEVPEGRGLWLHRQPSDCLQATKINKALKRFGCRAVDLSTLIDEAFEQ